MSSKAKFTILLLIFAFVGIATMAFVFTTDIAVLNPKGLIAEKQRNLMNLSVLLMLIVVIPVVFMTFLFAWKYRADNKNAKYEPKWDNSHLAEAIWWGVPCVIILILGAITYKACHELDPFRPIDSNQKPLTIQVVALRWKWLFIYPEQKIASVNFMQIPEKTQVKFEITSDAPMNSFWIPQLAGQVYAMPGMRAELYVVANEPGNFRGSSANLSGEGFAGMTFTAKASTEEEFSQWAESVRQSAEPLTMDAYLKLAEPSQYVPPAFYSLGDEGLFNWVVMKYMGPMHHD